MDFPKTKDGNKHVLVLQDFLTKWPTVYPMPDQKDSKNREDPGRRVQTNVWCARGTAV